MVFLSTLLASVLITAFTVPVLTRVALRYSVVDLPNERKVHEAPVPRVGGLAMALGMAFPVGYWIGDDPFVRVYLAGAAVLVLFGLLDDCCDLRPRWKLLGQGIAASLAVLTGQVRIVTLGTLLPGFLLPEWVSIPFTIFVIVGVTNAINLADGLDGLAGGIGLLSLCCISYLAFLQNQSSVAIVTLALAGATFAFLRYNTYPASIFMGDTGSQLLGYSCVTLSVALTQTGALLSPMLPLIILGFPVLDTVSVMVGRIARGVSPFTADRSHFHHTLLELGLHHSESVTAIYLIQVALIATAFLFRSGSDRFLFGLYLCFSILVVAIFTTARKKRWQVRRMGAVAVLDSYLDRLRDITLIKILFRPLEIGLVMILIVTALLNQPVPPQAAGAAVFGIVALLLIIAYRPQLVNHALKVTLYLAIPFIIYGTATRFSALPPLPLLIYRLLFALLALLDIFVSGLSRRIHGFQRTPLDFLVLLIALAAPQLSGAVVPLDALGIVAAKIVICYFSCEVIFAEGRGDITRLALGTFLLLGIITARGLF